MSKIVIDPELCKGCKLCIPVCAKKLICQGDVFNSKGAKPMIQVHEENCTGCKLCAIMCPDAAISVYR